MKQSVNPRAATFRNAAGEVIATTWGGRGAGIPSTPPSGPPPPRMGTTPMSYGVGNVQGALSLTGVSWPIGWRPRSRRRWTTYGW